MKIVHLVQKREFIYDIVHMGGLYVSAVRVTCKGRDSCTSSDDSSSIILLSFTNCTGPRGRPRMELAFLMSLSSL